MIFLTLVLAGTLARADSPERFIPCGEVLSPKSKLTVPKIAITERLDGWVQTWRAYRNEDPAADLVVLVAADRDRTTLSRLLISETGLTGFFPGLNLTDHAHAEWLSADDIDEVADTITDTPEDRRRIVETFSSRPTCRPGHVDSITVIDEPGRTKPRFWESAPLSLVYVTEKTCVVRHRESSMLLGLRGTARPLPEWLAQPLELLARDEAGGPGRAAFPPAALKRIAAIYVAVPSPRKLRPQ